MIIPCEYGKYASIDVKLIVDRRLLKNKNVEVGYNLVPIIVWSVDDDGNRLPILIDNSKHIRSVIVDVESSNWWWYPGCTGDSIDELKRLIESIIEALKDE